MKTMFLVAAAAFTLGIGSAYAQGSPRASGYVYPDFWGKQTAQTTPQGDAAGRMAKLTGIACHCGRRSPPGLPTPVLSPRTIRQPQRRPNVRR